MRNYKILENLCDKLEDWGIDPITLAKAVSIFLILVIIIGLMVAFPILFVIVLVTILCIAMVGLIYLMLE